MSELLLETKIPVYDLSTLLYLLGNQSSGTAYTGVVVRVAGWGWDYLIQNLKGCIEVVLRLY